VADSGEYAIILKQKGPTPVGFYRKGDSFGELALMYNTPRAATIQCISGGLLWALDRMTFRKIMMNANKNAAASTAMFLKSVSFLSTLTDQQRDAIGSVLQEEVYGEGDVIVRQGEKAEALYVVKEGMCRAHRSNSAKGGSLGREVARMKEGGIFGESALSSDSAHRAYSVVAASPETHMFRLNRKDFVELLGDLKDLVKQNFTLKVLASMTVFQQLSRTQQAILTDSLEERKLKKDEVVFSQGDTASEFYIVVSGSVRLQSRDAEGQTILVKDKLSMGNYFGEMAIMEDRPHSLTATANEDTVLQWLNKRVFNNLVGSMEDILKREAERRKRESERKSRPPMMLEEMEVMRTLGVGSFGRVKMVRHKPTDTPYALKCMRKGQMVAMRQVEHVRNEKNILEMCDHPFLLRMEATFQDADELYMVFELILGGELFTVLRAKNKFSFADGTFYAACVASAFTYLHERRIVYRDLKPENLMINAEGYAKVVDFGFAKIVEDKTYTLCGTPDYLAPEIIQNKGHNLSCDWWSFGVLCYEFLTGYAPFEAEDPMDVYNNILSEEPKFPMFFNGIARTFIEALLTRNPARRLGSLGLGALDILEHDFFADISFQELELMSIPPPFVPTIDNPLDDSNFDEDEEDDEEDEEDEDMQEQLKQWKAQNTDPSLFSNF